MTLFLRLSIFLSELPRFNQGPRWPIIIFFSLFLIAEIWTLAFRWRWHRLGRTIIRDNFCRVGIIMMVLEITYITYGRKEWLFIAASITEIIAFITFLQEGEGFLFAFHKSMCYCLLSLLCAIPFNIMRYMVAEKLRWISDISTAIILFEALSFWQSKSFMLALRRQGVVIIYRRLLLITSLLVLAGGSAIVLGTVRSISFVRWVGYIGAAASLVALLHFLTKNLLQFRKHFLLVLMFRILTAAGLFVILCIPIFLLYAILVDEEIAANMLQNGVMILLLLMSTVLFSAFMRALEDPKTMSKYFQMLASDAHIKAFLTDDLDIKREKMHEEELYKEIADLYNSDVDE